ncbi:MAG: efflux RND transporter periplasmic adaptor subunit [Campylobacter sp.]
MIKKIIMFFISVSCSFGEKIYANFDVLAHKSSALAFSSIGVVDKINVNVGDFVKKGDVLIELESQKERLGVEMAQNDLDTSKLALDHAQKTYEKFMQVQDYTSKQNFENVKFELDGAKLAFCKAKIALQTAKQRLFDKILLAPYDAVVSKKMVELGEGVAGVSQKVMEIFSKADVKLVLSFDEKFKDKVKIGDEFKFSLNGEANQTAKIALIYPTIDKKNQKIYAEVYTKNITPGLFGEGYILVK